MSGNIQLNVAAASAGPRLVRPALVIHVAYRCPRLSAVVEATVEVAAHADDGELLRGPYREPAGAGERSVEDATTA